MAISLTEDFKTIEELGKKAKAIVAQARDTGRPINITVEGKPAAVVLDVVTFERMLRALNLIRLVAPAEEDVLAGRTKSLDQFMKEFYLANQIPGSDKRGGGKERTDNSRLHRSGKKDRRRQVGS
jgi:prevent-host-death family protein